MAVLNLRSVPDDLMRDLKKAAIDAGEPFHVYCVHMLSIGLRSLGQVSDEEARAVYGGQRFLIVGVDESRGVPDETVAAVFNDSVLSEVRRVASAFRAAQSDTSDSGRPQRGSGVQPSVKVDIT